MITKIETNFTNVVAFDFSGEISKDDFESTVFPAIKAFKDNHDEINMVYVLNTDIKNFTANAWLQDALLGLKNLTDFNRVAIVTSSDAIQGFTEAFSKVIPGDFRGFEKSEQQEAIRWSSEGK